MTYESLSDGGFATGSMLGSEVSLCIMTLLASYVILGTLLVLSSRKLWTMPPCREGTGWLEKYTESKTVTDVKKTLICYGVSK
jgi:NADH-quinone oxidoreductase subunit F